MKAVALIVLALARLGNAGEDAEIGKRGDLAILPSPHLRVSASSTHDQIRSRILATARHYIGMREATGKNDGPDIERWLRLVGARKGDPWCAAAVHGVGFDAGHPVFPKTAWSPGTVAGGWRLRDHPSRVIEPASAFGIWFSAKGRVAHTGLVEKDGKSTVTTLEGNTDGAGSRDGNGFYRKFRLRSQIHSARDWVK